MLSTDTPWKQGGGNNKLKTQIERTVVPAGIQGTNHVLHKPPHADHCPPSFLENFEEHKAPTESVLKLSAPIVCLGGICRYGMVWFGSIPLQNRHSAR